MTSLSRETADAPGEITRLLDAHRQGDAGAFGELLPLVYDDLRRLARRQLGRGRPDAVLDTTGLVHELYLKLAGPRGFDSVNRGHFFHLAARAMRQVVIGYARKRSSAKRGGGRVETTLDDGHLAIAEDAERLLAVDAALARLGERDPRLVQVVECRFFAGLSESETAEALGTSLRTAQRDWNRARAWLREELAGASAP
ncbi:MAG: ECF-type sigma factor [Thermoanaerobaculia bacterium]|nr:ECF-type sigma factor [Thermoanaerobaculia bacterium]